MSSELGAALLSVGLAAGLWWLTDRLLSRLAPEPRQLRPENETITVVIGPFVISFMAFIVVLIGLGELLSLAALLPHLPAALFGTAVVTVPASVAGATVAITLLAFVHSASSPALASGEAGATSPDV
jgi:hypothetical protein